MIRIIIAGGRTFNDYEFLEKHASNFLLEIQDQGEIQIVSGGAKGVDSMGEKFAKEKGLDLKIFKADWKKFGRAAGPKRNLQMAEYSTHLLSFWDGKSRGTKSMIELAKKNKIHVKIIHILE